MTKLFDALIIGGGPAGLAAALALSRALRTCVVFEKSTYRNDAAHRMHTVPGHDHIEPAEFRRRAKNELVGGRYDTTVFADAGASTIEKSSNDGFQVVDEHGTSWNGKTVILATGSRDVMPDLKGYKEAWGRSIWQCLFCDGFEQRDAESAGLLLTKPLGNQPIEGHLLQAMLARRFARNITIFTDGDDDVLDNARLKLLANKGFRIEKRRIVELRYPKASMDSEDSTDLDVILEDGRVESVKFLVHKPPTSSYTKLAEGLGVTSTSGRDLSSQNVFGQTNVEGVYVAGDAMTSMKAVLPALNSGVLAGGGVHHYLIEKELAA